VEKIKKPPLDKEGIGGDLKKPHPKGQDFSNISNKIV